MSDHVRPPDAAEAVVHVMPTSFAQQRFWLLDQMAPDAAAYTMPAAYRLVGSLNRSALERALNAVVTRHEALRTSFRLENEAPVQVIYPAWRISLPVEYLSSLPAAEREATVMARIAAAANAPFDLTTCPLIRAQLLALGGDEHVLVLVLHHIVADGWSLGVLFKELAAFYAAFSGGPPAQLPPLPLQYPDYAVWERGQMERGKLEQGLAFWRERLREPLPVLELPTDRPRPSVASLSGAKRETRLVPEIAEAVRALSRQEGTTPFMTLLAAYEVLLHRLTGQDDLVIGSITSGRERPEVQPLIGLFVNTVALRGDLSGDPSFSTLLRRVRDGSLAAYAHQQVPFDMVVDAVLPLRDRSRSPLFQTVFEYFEDSSETVLLPGLTASPLRSPKSTTKFEFTLTVAAEPGGGFRVSAEFSTDLFDPTSIDALLDRYLLVVSELTRDPRSRISTVPILSEAERSRLADAWAGAPEKQETLHPVCEGVTAQAALTPQVTAVLHGDRRLSYAHLESESNRLAQYLVGTGLTPAAPVGVFLDRSVESVVAMLAAFKAGAAYLPLDPALPPARLSFMLDDARAAVVITTSALAGRLPPEAGQIIRLDADAAAIRAEPDSPLPRRIGPEETAYLIYTSGSTGRPKGVAVPHRALMAHCRDIVSRFDLGPTDRVLQFAALSFDPSLEQILPTLLAGATLVLRDAEPWSPGSLLAKVREHALTVMDLPPAYFREWVAELGLPGNHHESPLRLVVVGGEEMPADAVRKWFGTPLRTVRLINAYGPTEATITSMMCEVGPDSITAFGRVPIGRPVGGRRVYLLDRHHGLVPPGVVGEICIGGDSLATGYHGRPDLTAEFFVPDPWREVPGARMYRTGDLGRLLPDGSVEFLGRRDTQVKLRGFRIEPGEIEALLAAHPAVQDCAVVPVVDANGEARLVAYCAARPGLTLEARELREMLAAALPAYMVPAAFMVLPELPLTSSGKVDRRALPAPSDDAETGRPASPPRNATEARLAQEMAAVLGRESVGIDDDFFALGGHSLHVMRLVGRLRRSISPDISLQAVFEHPTVAALAGWIGAAAPGAATTSAIPRRTDGARAPLSFLQMPLWVQTEMEPEVPSYNVPVARRLRGPLDGAALGRAFSAVVRHHESLRTVFRLEQGEPVQLVQTAESAALTVLDLSGSADPLTEATALAQSEARRPFDLSNGPLVRLALYRLGPDDHLLVCVAHHIVCDGWSVDLFLADLSRCYAAGTAQLVAPPIRYGDFAAWQRDRLGGQRLEELTGYWKGALAGVSTAIEMPTDFPRTQSTAGPGASATRMLPAELMEAVKRLAERHRSTPFMVLLAAWAAVINRYTGQSELLIGTPTAGRDWPETEGVIGHFANVIALPLRVDRDLGFTALLGQVREVSLGALAHAELPFEYLAQELRPRIATGALLPVAFSLQNAISAGASFSGLAIEPVRVDPGASNYELSLSMAEVPGGLLSSLTYRSDLFEASTIERLQDHLGTLLAAAVAAPDLPVALLPLLPAAERVRMLVEWNRTDSPYPRDSTVAALFEEQARRTPDRVALVWDDGSTTFGDLNRRANRMAWRLRALGVEAGSRVGVCLERSPDLVAALVAIAKLGAAYVPLDPSYPPERLALMVEDAAAAAIVATRSTSGSLPAGADGRIILEDEAAALAALPEANPLPAGSAESPLYVIYTSGSTGRPKGAVIPNRAVVRLVRNTNYAELTEAEVFLLFAPITFDASTLEVWAPLLNGGRLVLYPPGPPALDELGSVIRRHGVTTMFLTTALFNQMVDAGLKELVSLRQLLTGGEAHSLDHFRRGRAALPCCRIVHVYGPTENTTFSTYHPIPADDPLDRPVPIGRPIANTTAYVLDERLEPVPVLVGGELYTGGDGLALEYLNLPEISAERFVRHPFLPGQRLYRTGDRVRYLADGSIEFLGRLDGQVKIRGFRIEPGEIEVVLREHPQIRDAFVICREDTPGDKRLVAYHLGYPGTGPDDRVLREYLRERLPQYMIPSAFMRLDAFPVNPNGKVDRRALPAPTPAAGDGAVRLAPRTPAEAAVARVWCEVLHVDQVGVDESFFDLGGHSLLATQVVGRLWRLFQCRLPLRAFFDAPTVAGVAEALVRYEPRPGHVATVARILQDIEAMPEAERHARAAKRANPDAASAL